MIQAIENQFNNQESNEIEFKNLLESNHSSNSNSNNNINMDQNNNQYENDHNYSLDGDEDNNNPIQNSNNSINPNHAISINNDTGITSMMRKSQLNIEQHIQNTRQSSNRLIFSGDQNSILIEPPRSTGLLMKFIFLFHPILLFLFILPSILTFWILFITGGNSLKSFIYIVFLLVPFIFQMILLIYHSRSCLFLNYGRQAVSRRYYNSHPDDPRYQLIDLHTHSVVALLDKSIQDERAFYLYIPISNQVFNMTYYESTFKINPMGQWRVHFTWKALLSFLVFGVLLTELILLFVLKSWLLNAFN